MRPELDLVAIVDEAAGREEEAAVTARCLRGRAGGPSGSNEDAAGTPNGFAAGRPYARV